MKTFAKILLITLIASLALGILSGCGKGSSVVYSYDYFSEDLSKYIEIDESDYKGYTLTVKMGKITEDSVDQQIMHTLYEFRSDEAKNPGKTVALTVGDALDMWYRGYTIDENGREVELDGFSNMSSNLTYKLGIGSASMPLGVESSLVGVVIADYQSLESVAYKAGAVISETDVVYLSYVCNSPSGQSSASGVRVDLSRDDLDATFGTGFRAAILGKTLPENGKIGSFTTTCSDGKYVYSDVKIQKAYPKSAKSITVTATLPYDFEDYDLAGNTVYFEIFPHYFTAYEVPPVDETFILEVLELTEEDLASYEGATLVEKYRSSVRATLLQNNEEQLRTLREEAMWRHYNSVAKVISLPENAVLAVYNSDVAEIKTVWESYKTDYPDFDEFARAYLGLTADSDWKAMLRDDAEAEVTDKLIFYYIVRKENILPTNEEYKKLYDELFDEYVVYYMEGKTEEDYSDAEKYKTERAAAEKAVAEYYGEAFFRDQVYYDFAIDALLDYSNLELIEK